MKRCFIGICLLAYLALSFCNSQVLCKEPDGNINVEVSISGGCHYQETEENKLQSVPASIQQASCHKACVDTPLHMDSASTHTDMSASQALLVQASPEPIISFADYLSLVSVEHSLFPQPPPRMDDRHHLLDPVILLI